MRTLFYIMGKSASGKDSIYRALKKDIPELRPVVLYTTRPMRADETDGKDYFFIDEERLAEFEREGRIIEKRSYDTCCGIWTYATVEDDSLAADADFLAIGTLESYEAMCRRFGTERLVPLYIEVEDGVRLMRAVLRERQQEKPEYDEICRRFLADAEDFSEERLAACGITTRYDNADFGDCMAAVRKTIEEKRR